MSAEVAIDLDQHLIPEKAQQTVDTLSGFLRSRMAGRDVGTILGQDVGHRDLIWITGAYLRRRKVLAVEIDFELFFSSVTIIAAAARALLIIGRLE